MIHADTILLASRLARPVGLLDCMIVPVAAGARDSNGQPYGNDATWRRQLTEALTMAQRAIETAKQELEGG